MTIDETIDIIEKKINCIDTDAKLCGAKSCEGCPYNVDKVECYHALYDVLMYLKLEKWKQDKLDEFRGGEGI